MAPRRSIGLLVALVAVIAAVSVSASSAVAAADTVYCVNGKSTTLPTDVSGGSGSRALSEIAALAIIRVGGVFYVGNLTPGGRVFIDIPEGPGYVTPLLPGYSTNFVSLGACIVAIPQVTSLGACKSLLRADGTTGTFQQITVADWNDSTGKYFDATPANWIEGVGLTCDNPLALGYKAAGYNVAWGGKPDPGHDPKGVRGSGFNNIYPYFIK